VHPFGLYIFHVLGGFLGCIYVIENKVNGKKYVGQTVNWKKREREHFNRLKGGRHGNSHLQSSWNKYGESAFTFKILVDNLPEKFMDDMERGFIATFRTLKHEYGYNKESGGILLKKHSPESIDKMRQAHKNMTKETKERMRLGQLKKYAEGYICHNKGKKHTEETKRKFSEAQKKLHASGYTHPGRRKIIDSNGTIWASLASLYLALGASPSHIHRCLKSGKPYKGIYIKYYDEPIKEESQYAS